MVEEVGLTAPGNSLEISSNVSATDNMILRNLSASGYEGIDMYNSAGTQVTTIAHSNTSATVLPNSTWLGSRNAEPLYFVTNGTSPMMTILSGGDVGIGNTSPQEKLHITDTHVVYNAGTSAYGNGNMVIQATDTTRTVGNGAALTFAIPANTGFD